MLAAELMDIVLTHFSKGHDGVRFLPELGLFLAVSRWKTPLDRSTDLLFAYTVDEQVCGRYTMYPREIYAIAVSSPTTQTAFPRASSRDDTTLLPLRGRNSAARSATIV